MLELCANSDLIDISEISRRPIGTPRTRTESPDAVAIARRRFWGDFRVCVSSFMSNYITCSVQAPV